VNLSLFIVALVLAFVSALAGAVAYALRDFSKVKLEALLEKQGRKHRLQPLLEHLTDFTLLASCLRPVSALLMLGALLKAFENVGGGNEHLAKLGQYGVALTVGCLLAILSVGVASSAAKYFGESLIARLDPVLHGLRAVFWPVLVVLHMIDTAVFRISPASKVDREEAAEQNVEEEILAVVEEGEKEGVVDQTDREMIESVIEFKDTTAGQIMTARPEIVGMPADTTVDAAVKLLLTSGHSRIPVYEKDLDHILGVLYARDMLPRLLESKRGPLDLKRLMRKPLVVPESKGLKELLSEFRLRKVHMAIVLDEFGGTAGLVTIEDILEELVGEISDEHEPTELAALLKVSDDVWEVDARTYVDEVNSVIGLSLPEDEGYDTLGGYVSSLLGRIPTEGEEFATPGAKWVVIKAEPTRVSRLMLTLVPIAEEAPAGNESEGLEA
jgi:putative hemolysin